MRACVCLRMCVSVRTFLCVSVCVCVCMHVCVCVCGVGAGVSLWHARMHVQSPKCVQVHGIMRACTGGSYVSTSECGLPSAEPPRSPKPVFPAVVISPL